MLVAARAVQGFGGALLFPATLTLIFVSFEEGPARTRALAVWGGAGSAGLAAGALLGGLLTNYVGWPWVFLINVPLAVAALLAAPRLLPRDRAQGGARGGFDVSGALIATLGVSLVVFGVVAGPDAGWMSLRGAGAIVAGLAALAVLVGVEARSRSPLMPLRMFGNRSLVTTIAIIFIFMGALSTEYYLLTTYIQKILGYDALQAGLAFLPLGLCSMVGAGRMSTVAVERRGNRVTLAGGMAGIAAGMSVGGSYWALLPGIVGWGLFGGMTFAVMFASAAAGVAPEQQGVASALASTAQQVGAAVGLAALVAVANAGLDLRTERSATSAVVHGLRTAGWVAAAATVVGALIALTLRARPAGGPDTTPGTGNTGSEHDQSERLTT